MISITTALGLCVLALVLFRLNSIRRKWTHAAEAAKRGCSKLPVLPRMGFLGLGRLSEVHKANLDGRTPQWFIEKFDGLGEDVHTFSASALDYELIVTRDPENAKAAFSSLARDFEISPHRKDIWGPLLGEGIFTAQGEAWKHSRQLLRPQVSDCYNIPILVLVCETNGRLLTSLLSSSRVTRYLIWNLKSIMSRVF
jgi:hypothetical protein